MDDLNGLFYRLSKIHSLFGSNYTERVQKCNRKIIIIISRRCRIHLQPNFPRWKLWIGVFFGVSDKYGFPRTKAKSERIVKGFRTGDMIKATVIDGRKVGDYTGRVAIRITGNFCIYTTSGKVDGISYRNCRVIHKADGYQYGILK